MGNMSFAYYMNNYGNDKYLPHLQKVNIAGTYNGVLNLNEKINEINLDRNGKPNKMNDDFKKLLSLKEVYKDKNIDVLNIYGDIQDGTHSDGRVSNSSSKSLKYLLEIVQNLTRKINSPVKQLNIANYTKIKISQTTSFNFYGANNSYS